MGDDMRTGPNRDDRVSAASRWLGVASVLVPLPNVLGWVYPDKVLYWVWGTPDWIAVPIFFLILLASPLLGLLLGVVGVCWDKDRSSRFAIAGYVLNLLVVGFVLFRIYLGWRSS